MSFGVNLVWMNELFALHQGERGVPGVPGDAGEKGDPGIGITGPSVSTCLWVTWQTLSSFKGIVHTKQKIYSFTQSHVVPKCILWNTKAEISVCSTYKNIVQHWTCTSQMNNCYGTFCQNWRWQWLYSVPVSHTGLQQQWLSHRTTQSALSFLHPTYFP